MDRFEQIEVTFMERRLFNDHVRQFSKEAFIGRMQRVLDEKIRI
jgi:hypothetical protein